MGGNRRPFFEGRSKLVIFLLDLVFLAFALKIFTVYKFGPYSDFYWTLGSFFLISSVCTGAHYALGLYDFERTSIEAWLIRHAVSFVVSVVGLSFLLFLLLEAGVGLFGRVVLVGSLALFTGLSFALRCVVSRRLGKRKDKSNLLVIVTAQDQSQIQSELNQNGVSGQIHYLMDKAQESASQAPCVGNWRELPKVLQQQPWGLILLAVPEGRIPLEMGESLMEARFQGYNIMTLGQFYEAELGKVPIMTLTPEWFILHGGFNLFSSRTRNRLKRAFDILTVGLFFVACSPLLVLTALYIKLVSRGPALYSQTRVGKDDVPFTIYKFRTMRPDAEKDGAQWAQKKDPRVIPGGHLIRALRLDELPQLWNVLSGDMSFVGPRPERPEFIRELEKQIPFYKLRHLVKPGLTGWAQVSYSYGASVNDAKEKLQFELFYIKNQSFLLDCLIVLRTFGVVLLGKGR